MTAVRYKYETLYWYSSVYWMSKNWPRFVIVYHSQLAWSQILILVQYEVYGRSSISVWFGLWARHKVNCLSQVRYDNSRTYEYIVLTSTYRTYKYISYLQVHTVTSQWTGSFKKKKKKYHVTRPTRTVFVIALKQAIETQWTDWACEQSGSVHTYSGSCLWVCVVLLFGKSSCTRTNHTTRKHVIADMSNAPPYATLCTSPNSCEFSNGKLCICSQ